MSRGTTPYVFAQSSARADEAIFHRRNVAERLLALAAGRKLVLAPAQLGRRAGLSGPAVRVYARHAGADEPLGYVLRPGLDSEDLRQRLWEAIDGVQADVVLRRAA